MMAFSYLSVASRGVRVRFGSREVILGAAKHAIDRCFEGTEVNPLRFRGALGRADLAESHFNVVNLES
jgi:hypothetical protein